MRYLLLSLFAMSAVGQTSVPVTINVPVVAGPQGIPGPAGPSGPPGPTGPGPTNSQIAAAISAYMSSQGTNPAPGCPVPQPPPTSVTIPCPSGFTGSWQQTTSYSCPTGATSWVMGVSPTSAPAGACVAQTTPPPCIPTAYSTTNAYDFVQYGNYIVNNNNWGGTSGQVLKANSQSCWGVTTTATTDRFGIGSYPSGTRGWTQNQTALNALGGVGWTVKSGMGIPVGSLTKARVHWAFVAPGAPNRWSALMDIYFHKVNNPDSSMFYPQLDLMVEPSIGDQVNSDGTTYYESVINNNRGTKVTVGGNTYEVYVDNPSQKFNQPGGHTIEMFMAPTAVTQKGLAVWGSNDSVTDVAAIIKYWMQAQPMDDSGSPIVSATTGAPTGQVITPDLFLNVINAGFEIDDGTSFTTTAFCVAMQGEPDCQ